jgi:hypothetical protein
MRSTKQRVLRITAIALCTLAACSQQAEPTPPQPARAQTAPSVVAKSKTSPSGAAILPIADDKALRPSDASKAVKGTAAPKQEPTTTSRALLARIPKESLLVLRFPAVERLGEAWQRTSLAKLMESPELSAPFAAELQQVQQRIADARKLSPAIAQVIDLVLSQKGELVIALTSMVPGQPDGNGGFPVSFTILFDAGDGADALQKGIDTFLDSMPKGRTNPYTRKTKVWGFEGGPEIGYLDVAREGTVFDVILGARSLVQGQRLDPKTLTESQSFLACDVVRGTPDLGDQGGQPVLEAYLHIAPLWSVAKLMAPPEVTDVLNRSGLMRIQGGSLAIALGAKGISEALTLCSPGVDDIISTALVSKPMNKTLARWIPAAAESAGLYTLDLARLFTDVCKLIPAADRGGMDRAIDDLRNLQGIDLKGGLFENVGPTFAVMSQGDIASWVASGKPSICAAIEVADPAKAERLIASMLVAQDLASKVKSSIVGEATIREVEFVTKPGSPSIVMSWCRMPGCMLISTDRALLENALAAGQSGQECGNVVFREALEHAGSNAWSVGVTAARAGLPPTIAYGRWTASGLSVESRDGSGALTMEGLVQGVAVLSSLAIPQLLEARSNANENAAMSTLRVISSAQAMAVFSAVLDLDRDGGGEYLFLDELCGVKNLRGTDHKCEPALLSSKWEQAAGGVVTRSGYAFRIDLPSRDGKMISVSTASNGRDVSVEDAEIEYVVYAWPLVAGNTADHVFVLDQEGELWVSDNKGRRQGYSGLANPPPHDAWDSAWGTAAFEKGKFTDVNGAKWTLIPHE